MDSHKNKNLHHWRGQVCLILGSFVRSEGSSLDWLTSSTTLGQVPRNAHSPHASSA